MMGNVEKHEKHLPEFDFDIVNSENSNWLQDLPCHFLNPQHPEASPASCGLILPENTLTFSHSKTKRKDPREIQCVRSAAEGGVTT